MNKILIIDDDRELCALIKRSVQAENIEADFCNTGKEGLQKLREQEYQLVVLDVMMPGMDGFETLEEIRKENSLPILMFTSKNDSISKVRGLRAGADDYLTKPFDMDVLTAKIQAILRRTYSFGTPGNVLEYKGIVLSPSRCTLTWNGNDIDLTKNELRILEILMEHAGKVVSRDAIMTKLWESDSFIDDNTLTVNITRLRRKLEGEGLKDFIITKKGLGYMV
mgnify:CR=1 FL=1